MNVSSKVRSFESISSHSISCFIFGRRRVSLNESKLHGDVIKMNERNTGALTRLIGGRIIITDGQYHACVTRCHEMSDDRDVKVEPTCGMNERPRFITTLLRFIVTFCTITMTMRNISI